jgi:hypothetical protein
MTPQMDPNEAIHDRPDMGYRGYEGSQEYERRQQYSPPSYGEAARGGAYDDDFIDGLAQRLSQRMTQRSQGKVQPDSRRGGKGGISAGQRLALAIVSVCVLIPITAIALSVGGGGLASLLALGAVCLTLFLVNAVFNGMG